MNEAIRTVIVDDEMGALNAVKSIITKTAPELRIVGSARTVESAYELITDLKPKLVFLDIQLKDQTGFDLLQKHFVHEFEVVFVTAFDEYAIRAFEVNALSYLLKPISIKAFKKVKTHIVKLLAGQDTLSSSKADQILGKKIAIPNGSAIDYLTPDEIMFIRADGSYSELYLQDGTKLLLSKGLSHVEGRIKDDRFFRPHRSYLVNCSFIKRWNKADGGWLIAQNDYAIPISRAGRSLVEHYFGQS